MRTPAIQSEQRAGSEPRDGQGPLQNLASAQQSLERAALRLARVIRRQLTAIPEREGS